ncbi:polysaccharide biosynthesis/export family protein [Saccharicrinis sp. GN24d3]|uniref:polysaccharide biosynthesis/export family protein n=1 Tax=Saccharicrinis sp. GN24d3 TaxID=3458416 RepID=UPI004035FD84
MTSKQYLFLMLVLCMAFFSSCVSRKKLTYLQYSGSIGTEQAAGRVNLVPLEYKLMPYDNLYINVVSPDPKWSAMFNPVAGEGTITEESAILQGYVVDSEGNIEIPFVGKVYVEGQTLNSVKIKLESTFSSYVKDASITVRLVNNYVSLMGEVGSPGRYPLTKNRVNIFEALAMAGDLADYSDRRKIQLIRPTAYGPVVKEFSLSDRSILESEYYYVMPNDIIYAPPLKGRTFQMNSAIYSIVLGVLNTGFVVYALIQNQN